MSRVGPSGQGAVWQVKESEAGILDTAVDIIEWAKPEYLAVGNGVTTTRDPRPVQRGPCRQMALPAEPEAAVDPSKDRSA